jgi:hypothetical protein
VVVGKYSVSRLAQKIDFLHISPVTASEAVFENDKTSRLRLWIPVKIPSQSVPHGRFEIVWAVCHIGKIVMREIMGQPRVITAGEKTLLVETDYLFFKKHRRISFVRSNL